MLSAKDSEFGKVIGLELADDVTKPFSNRELQACVGASSKLTWFQLIVKSPREEIPAHFRLARFGNCSRRLRGQKYGEELDLTTVSLSLISLGFPYWISDMREHCLRLFGVTLFLRCSYSGRDH